MWDEGSEGYNEDFVYRELFPEDEARLFARPEIRLPTTSIAYASVLASFIFALILVFSHRQEREKKTSLSTSRSSDSTKRLRTKPSKPNQLSVPLHQ